MDEGFVGLIFSVFNHDKTSKVSCMSYKQSISYCGGNVTHLSMNVDQMLTL